MTKQEFQKELNEKVKPGVKPSHLKKLKRSKSDGDIPKAPPLPQSTPLSKSQSQLEIPLAQPSLKEQITQLQEQVKLLQDQLSEKQQEIENLRKQLEIKNTPTDLTELDNSLQARHKSLKDWFTQYSKNKKLDNELQENIDEASTELTQQGEIISQLRSENSKLKKTNQSLQKDLNLVTKLAELRKNPLPSNNPDYSHLLVYAFLTFWFISLLNSSWKRNTINHE